MPAQPGVGQLPCTGCDAKSAGANKTVQQG